MKKKLAIVIMMVLVLTVVPLMTACGNSGGTTSNDSNATGTPATAEDSSDLTSDEESGESGDSQGASNDNVISDEMVGIEIGMPKAYLDNKDKVFLDHAGGQIEEGLFVLEAILYPAPYEELIAMDQAAFGEASQKTIDAMFLFRALDEKWSQDDVAKWCKDTINLDTERLELVATFDQDGDKWSCYGYFANQDDIPENLGDEISPIYESIIDEFNELKTDVKLKEMKNPALENDGKQLVFTSKDVDGNDVTSEEIFAGAEYTMVNCWASWCGPCIQELPEIEEMSKDFEARGGQVIGILMDGDKNAGLADGKDILADTGVTYLNVISNADIAAQVSIVAYPTTYFVDSNGTIIGEAVIGAAPDRYISKMNELLGE